MRNELTKSMNDLLKNFEECAGRAYWELDQGNGKAVAKAEKDLVEARAALVRRLETLQRSLKRASGKPVPPLTPVSRKPVSKMWPLY